LRKGKYGRKNKIKLDPLAYNLMLIGETGIGKTTIIKEYCEKLAGEDGYMFLQIGKEDGADAIHDIDYETVEDWEKLDDVITDIVENKSTDYSDLRVVVFDTYDGLFDIAEPEVIAMNNRENPKKRTNSINGAFGGYQAGQSKAIEIVLDMMWSLKKVGVSFIVIGHTKTKELDDPISGISYTQLTTNLSQKYFKAMSTKVHFLGVAAIDREIIKEKTGKKDFATKQELTRGVVKGAIRKINFRDDNYVIDSKSRFSEIVNEIPMEVDELIKAIKDAILAEHNKSGKSVEESKKEQEAEEAAKFKKIAENEKANKSKNELDKVIAKITNYILENKSDMKKIKPILDETKKLGYVNPTEISDIDDAKDVLALI